MNKIKIFLILILLLIFILSFQITEDAFDSVKFSAIIDIINVTQVLISFYIAYLLYDRFGTSKKILDKQNELIIEYLEELKKISINVFIFEGDKLKFKIKTPIHREINLSHQHLEKDKILLVKSNYFSLEKIEKFNMLVNHPLFPIDIKKQLEVFNYSVLTNTFSTKKEDYVFLSFEDENDFDMTKWMMIGNEENITVFEFYNKLKSLIITVENWINKESSIRIKLNF